MREEGERESFAGRRFFALFFGVFLYLCVYVSVCVCESAAAWAGRCLISSPQSVELTDTHMDTATNTHIHMCLHVEMQTAHTNTHIAVCECVCVFAAVHFELQSLFNLALHLYSHV